jgi:hypothetical protein
MFQPSRLPGFMSGLRAAGYRIDVDCEVRILALLARWSAQGEFPATSVEFANWLSPLISATEKQQAEFRTHFEFWFGTWRAEDRRAVDDAEAVDATPAIIRGQPEVLAEPLPASAQGEKAKRRGHGRSVLIVVALILVMLPFGYLLSRNFPNLNFGPIRSQGPTVTKEPSSKVRDVQDFSGISQLIATVLASWLTYGVGTAVLVGPLVIFLMRRRNVAARFRYYAGAPRVTFNLVLQPTLISERDRRKERFRSLSSFLSVPSNSLDLPRTVDQSITQGGLFVPVYATKKIAPEYDVLIDRVRASDHLARLFKEYVDSLVSAGTYCDVRYFQRDPRQCFDVDGRRSNLAALGRHQSERRLIIMSDGSGLLDPVTGKPGPWIEDVQAWRDRVVLTPRHPAIWSEREAILAEQVPIGVVPAIGNWIELLAVTFGDRERSGLVARGSSDDSIKINNLFALLADRPFRWTDQARPDDEVVQHLVSALETGLPGPILDWLSACAVYPVLTWHMTLALGRGILDSAGRPLLTEERLLVLSQLPWFRRGSMPIWLREALIARMTDPRYEEVRALLESGLSLFGGRDLEQLPLRITLGAETGKLAQPAEDADVVLLDFVRRRRAKGVDLYMIRHAFDALSMGKRNDPSDRVWRNLQASPFAAPSLSTIGAISISHAGLRDRLGNEWMAVAETSSLANGLNVDGSEWRSALFLELASDARAKN